MVANSYQPHISLQFSIAKPILSLFGAAIIAVVLLFAMTQLIRNDMPALESERLISIPTFTLTPKDETPEVVKIKPLELTPPPSVKKTEYEYDRTIDNTGLTLDIPEDTTPPDDPIITAGLPAGMALIPLSARYPDRAAQSGLCGLVVVRYDIATDGVPFNIAIVESSHRWFDKSAIRAVEKARFKPDSIAGKPIVLRNKYEKIIYQLEGGC